MRTYSTHEARTKFAEIIDNSLRNPIAIARHGRVVSIVMAKEEYDHYQEMEEQWWMNYKTIPSTDVSDEVNSRIAKLEQQLAKISNV
jgi:PHD/YefM family antitoxin component YafN of YafNO toxin-antitoxin module